MSNIRWGRTVVSSVFLTIATVAAAAAQSFQVVETTIEDIHRAYRAGTLTARQLTQQYLDRIKAYDQQGPMLNCIISLNPNALADADKLDASFKQSGMAGPLHGIPVVLKDQFDAAGMPTTLGSILFKDYMPPDSFVAAKLRKAGAIILAKTTLGEWGAGDALGSALFGSSRNPYDLERTVGGSSGGNGSCLSANFATVGVGEEGVASIRRPSTWNSIVGLRPTSGLVSRTGMFHGWPDTVQSLGPMARTVTDLAKLLDVMVGYDPEDPLTALGVGRTPTSYTHSLDPNGLKGARIGVLREPFGAGPAPDNDDTKKVNAVFQKNLEELKAAGATLLDPIVIPELRELLAKRTDKWTIDDENQRVWLGRNPNSRYKTPEDVLNSPDYSKLPAGKANEWKKPRQAPADIQAKYYEYIEARQRLLNTIVKIMTDNNLDAFVYKSVEFQPPRINDELGPNYRAAGRVPILNTYLGFASAMSVPAGFTTDNLPTGLTFFGRPYDEPRLLRLAYAYEQATKHRVPPKTTPPLATASTAR